MDISKVKKIYFVGIKGVGMASLATIAKQAGFEMTGSDVSEEFITDSVLHDEGITPLVGFSKENITNFFEKSDVSENLVITTGAHGGFDNPEVVAAKSLGVTILTHGQAVGEFMKGALFGKNYRGISVAGAHGKTTTTAIIATYLAKLGQDPSYTVGTSKLFPLGSAGHYGKGDFFVAEADEYAAEIRHDRTPKLLYQFPEYAIVTNIDFDHPDLYKDVAEIEEVFVKFAKNISKGLIFCGDSANTGRLAQSVPHNKVLTYGYEPTNDYVISHFVQKGLNASFSIQHKNENLGFFSLSIPGKQSALNATAAIVLLLELGFSLEDIRTVTPTFTGTKRRSEKVGVTQNGAIVMDDYAHHPMEIQTTLSALSEVYADKKIVCVFQPHTFSRTQSLMHEFSQSFSKAYALLLLPTFASKRDTELENNDKEYVASFSAAHPNAHFSENRQNMVEYIKKMYDSGEYVIVTMGAGDIYEIGKDLIK
jgi:UDP-N-acetylmuramate--alanine ligase